MVKKILKKDNEIWDKIKNLFKKEFNNEPVCKTVNISLYIVNFYGNKMSEENECYTCLSVILLYSIFFNSYTEYYPQTFLRECKYALKELMNTKIVLWYIYIFFIIIMYFKLT